jgi:hypothetical protein
MLLSEKQLNFKKQQTYQGEILKLKISAQKVSAIKK